MTRNAGQDLKGWKEYRELLNGAGIAFVSVALVAAVVSTLSYCLGSAIIEQVNHRSLGSFWTCLLLLIPIFVQLFVFLRLRKRIKMAISNDELRAYFKFYFWRMALSLATYTVLWLLYVAVFGLNLGGRVVEVFAWLPLIGVGVLIGIIVHATHLITRTSFRDDELLLTDEEVGLRYDSIRGVMKAGASSRVEVIRQWLRKDRDCKVHLLALKKEIRDLDISHLTEALNRLICSRGFYDATTDGKSRPAADDLVPKDVEIANRKYLEDNLLETEGKQRVIDTRNERREHSEQEKLVKQKGQRDGIAMFPFYTMVFFFSIFLCTAYLFGFAFAFEDRRVQLTGSNADVALFMTDELREDIQQQTDPSLIRGSDIKNRLKLAYEIGTSPDSVSAYLRDRLKPRTLQLLKSYDSSRTPPNELIGALINDLNALIAVGSVYEQVRFARVSLRNETKRLISKNPTEKELAYLNRLLLEDAYPHAIARMSEDYRLHERHGKFFFDAGGAGLPAEAKEPSSRAQKYIVQINQTSLGAVTDTIRDVLNHEKALRVEVVGRADETAFQGNSYSSNSDVSAARIRTVRYAIQEKLIGVNVSAEKLAAIQWIELPLSNDPTLPPKNRESSVSNGGEGENNAFLVLQKSASAANPSYSRELEASIDSFRIDNVKKAKSATASEQIGEWWVRVRQAARKQPTSNSAMFSFYKDVESWALSNDDGAATAIKEKIERELYQLEDLVGSRRSVEVFIFESLLPRSDPQPDPPYKRMALIDYIYFAMYTITTTGYGDVKPITPYAKFLCTLANMTEFFFIVVFFNTLLSLRRRRELV